MACIICPAAIPLFVGAAIGGGAGAVIGGVSSKVSGGSFVDGAADGFMWGAISGAISGGVGAATGGAGIFAAAMADGAVDSSIYTVQTAYNGGDITVGGVLLSFGAGALASGGSAFAAKKLGTVLEGAGKPLGTEVDDVIEGSTETVVNTARSWQGSGRYPGIDDWSKTTYNVDDIIYRGEPGGTEFFTTKEAIEAVDAKQTELFEGLQVEAHPTMGYRSEMQGYQFKDVIEGAEAKCLANPDYGPGSLIQKFVPDANDLIKQGILEPVEKIILKK